MADITIVASPGTYVASLGAMIDTYARLRESYLSNPGLRDYSSVHTRLMVASISGERIEMAADRWIAADGPYAHAKHIRLLYLPSFQIPDPDRLQQVIATEVFAPFHRWLRDIALSGIVVGACGSAVCHLAAAGLLDGQKVTTSPRLHQAFHKLFPEVEIDTDAPLIRAGNIFTCALDSDAPDLALRMMEHAFFPIVTQGLRQRESPFSKTEELDGLIDPLVKRARIWMHDHFAQNLRIADVAEEFGVSHQTLIRRFRASGSVNPQAYLQQIRLNSAAMMLADTRRSVTEIALLVGYSDPAAFRRKFRVAFGISPAAFRRNQRRTQIVAATGGRTPGSPAVS